MGGTVGGKSTNLTSNVSTAIGVSETIPMPERNIQDTIMHHKTRY